MQSIADSVLLALQLITRADADLWRSSALSLRVSATACASARSRACASARGWRWRAFPVTGARSGCVNTLLALPSVVVGLMVYLLLSRSGPLGAMGILFTPTAMVIAQSILVCRWWPRCRADWWSRACAMAAISCARSAPGRSRARC